ncbi:MAG: IS21 family transposase [Polyangiaceae bacterium]
MTRLKVHHLSEGAVPHSEIASKCSIGLRSVERILTEPMPTLAEVVAGAREGTPRRGRPPKASDELRDRVRALLEAEPGIMATEVRRRARAWGYTGGRSAMAALVKQLRPAPKQEPVVLFDGLPGEYTQFDFGEVGVTYEDRTPDKLVFFAGRLKFSRFMHVRIGPDQRAETVVRGIVSCLSAFGGSSKEWVFDNPRTIRVSPIGTVPIVLHDHLRDLVAEMRVIPTFCAPRSGNQKGSVERLVGFVKRSFFLARKFRDREDVEAQLAQWLHEVNHERPSDATGRIPAEALVEEAHWLAERPPPATADDWPLRATVTVTPMGTVPFAGTSYFASAKRIGAPATLLVRARTVEILVGEERAVHPRQDHSGEVRRLPHQRQDMLAAVHGKRKLSTFRRQCLLELGQSAWAFLSVLVHRCPHGRWEEPCSELYDLLTVHGDDVLRAAFERCVRDGVYHVEAVRRALAEVA